MRVLAIYHAGAMLEARSLFESLGDFPDVELTVAAPVGVQLETVYARGSHLGINVEERQNNYHWAPVHLRQEENYRKGYFWNELAEVIECTQPDIIQVFDEPTSAACFQTGVLRRKFAPQARLIFYAFENRPLLLKRRWHLWRALRHADISAGAVASEEAARHLRQAGFPADKPLARIFWGIPTDIFASAPCLQREEFGPGCHHLIGFAGRLVREKGVALLIRAMEKLPRTVHLAVMGDGPMLSRLSKWSKQPNLAGRVHLMGVLEPPILARCLRSLDAIVLPSLSTFRWKEQYGRILAEAMAAGTAVIASNSGAIPEVVGEAAIIFPEGNVGSLRHAILAVLTQPSLHSSLQMRGVKRAQEELSVNVMARQLVNLYTTVREMSQ